MVSAIEPIVPAANRAQDIFLFLKRKGYSVYFPAQKLGECTEPYVVVKVGTTSQVLNYSSTQTFYDIICYVPHDQYSTLETFVDGVVEAMKGLRPMLKPTYDRTQPYLDTKANAFMSSVKYINYRHIV